MKLHFELEPSQVSNLLMLVNAGGMLASQSQQLIQALQEQIQAQQQPRPNGADQPAEQRQAG